MSATASTPAPQSGTPLRQAAARLISLSRSRAALALLLIVLGGLTEGIGLLLLIPLLGLAGLDVSGGALGGLERLLEGAFAWVGLRPSLLVVLIVFVLVMSAQTLLRHAQSTTGAQFRYSVAAQLRKRLYGALTTMSWPHFVQMRGTDFTHALTDEVDRVGSAAYYLASFMAQSVLTGVYVAFALHLAPLATLLAGACGLVLIRSQRAQRRRAALRGEDISAAATAFHSLIGEFLAGTKTVRAHALEGQSARTFSELADDMATRGVRMERSHADAQAWFQIGAVLLLSAVTYTSIEVLRLETATLLLILFVFVRLIARLAGLQRDVHGLLAELPALGTVDRLREACVAQPEARGQARGQSRGPATAAPTLKDRLQLRQVTYRYPDQPQPALQDLDLTLRAGETAAVVGVSGAGKTTLADLLLGLLAPSSGQVQVDGAPLAGDLAGWRGQVGYVPQEPFLFHDTIRQNLLWARPEASQQDLLDALQQADALEFVQALSAGLDTRVGDRGVTLSGGQRQRIALARALLRRPALLLLDEATSALDSESEARIQDAIERLHGEVTIVLIAHRLATARVADTILVLDGGRLVESGSWGDLLARPGGRFRELCQAQGISTDSRLEPAHPRPA